MYEGSTIGEYIILIPVDKLKWVEKNEFKVDSLGETEKNANSNEIFAYAYHYMRKKYGSAST